MSRQEQDEKELRKREEKAPQEKQYDEKYRRDPLGALVWPLILIWAGLVLLAANLGWLDLLLREPQPFGADAWSLIALGAGIILLLTALARLLLPEYRRSIAGDVVLGIIFVGIGLGNLTNWAVVWPLIIIGFGIYILVRAIAPRR